MPSKYEVVLTEEERARLRTLVGRGAAPARRLTHARVLLKADRSEAGPGWTDAAIAGALEIGLSTVALEVIDTISYETVRRTLKQTTSSRG